MNGAEAPKLENSVKIVVFGGLLAVCRPVWATV